VEVEGPVDARPNGDLEPSAAHRLGHALQARKVLGWPKICTLAHAFLRQYSYKGLKLAQLLGQLGVFLTLPTSVV
jgi:hypothetical protein